MSQAHLSTDRFPTLAALRAAHNDLLKTIRDTRSLPATIANVHEFLRRGVATGAHIEAEDDRMTAQSLLDYWSAMIYRAGQEPPDTTLAEFDHAIEPELDDSQCPYVGLEAFRQEQRDRFFGRRRLVNDFLVGRVRNSRLLALVGPIGSGKSSVLQAGLIPALKDGGIEGSAGWRYLAPITPTADPLTQLATLAPGVTAEALLANPGLLARSLSAAGTEPAVVLVDQFDELFTLTEDEQTQAAAIAALVSLADAPEARHTVLLGMRSDVESIIARYQELQSWFERGRVQLLPLSAAEMREAIERPAELVGLKFESGLVDRLIEDLLGEPSALPLLQFTLLELWERRDRNRITWAAYNQVGAGRQAITNCADAFYNSLDPEGQKAALQLLLQLVRLERGQDAATRRVRREALLQTGTARSQSEHVLARLIEERLVRVTPGATPADDQIELAHEALARNWPRLVDWMETERSTLEVRRKLEARAAEWVELGRGSAALLDAVQLAEAESWIASAKARRLGFDESLLALVGASRAAIEEAQQVEVRQAQALAEAERQRAEAQTRRAEEQARGRRRLGWALIALGVMFTVAIALASYAIQQAGVASQRAAEALTQGNARATEAVDLRTAQAAAVQNAAEADRQRQEAERSAQEAERSAQEARTSEAIAVSAQRTAESARINAERRQREARAGELAALAQAYSIDNPQLALLLAVEAVRTTTDVDEPVVGVADQVLRSAVLAFTGRGYYPSSEPLTSVAYDSTGQRLVTAGQDGRVLLWDPANPAAQPNAYDAGVPIRELALSRDGMRLATADEAGDSIRVWDLSAQSPARALAIDGSVSQIAMSWDGARLAVAGDNGVTTVWSLTDATTGRQLRARSPALTVALSPDGRWVLTGHADGIARLWDLNARDPISAVATTDRRDSLTTVAISPNGRWILIGSEDGDTHLWGLGPRGFSNGPYVLYGQADAITTIAVSPDSTLAATASRDGTTYLWRIEAKNDPAPRSVLRGHSDAITTVRFAPDGQSLVTASEDSTVGLWNLAAPDPGATEKPLYGHNGPANSAAFRPDGAQLATVGSDGSLRLWDLRAEPLTETTLPKDPKDVMALACSVVGRNMTSDEWAENLPDGVSYRETCVPH